MDGGDILPFQTADLRATADVRVAQDQNVLLGVDPLPADSAVGVLDPASHLGIELPPLLLREVRPRVDLQLGLGNGWQVLEVAFTSTVRQDFLHHRLMVSDGDVGVVVFIETLRDVAGHHVFIDLIDQGAFEQRHQVHLDHTYHANPIGIATVSEELLTVPYSLLGNPLKGGALMTSPRLTLPSSS